MRRRFAQRVRWGSIVAFLTLAALSWVIFDATGGLDAAETPAPIVINEIHYNPAPGGVEFLELYNAGDQPIDVSGYDVAGKLTLAQGTVIGAGEYLVLTADLSLFSTLYPGVPAVEWTAGQPARRRRRTSRADVVARDDRRRGSLR